MEVLICCIYNVNKGLKLIQIVQESVRRNPDDNPHREAESERDELVCQGLAAVCHAGPAGGILSDLPPGPLEGNTEGPGTTSSEPLLPS